MNTSNGGAQRIIVKADSRRVALELFDVILNTLLWYDHRDALDQTLSNRHELVGVQIIPVFSSRARSAHCGQ